MKKLAVAALLAALATLAPNIASAKVSGVLAIGYENTQFDNNNNRFECLYCIENSEDGPNLTAAIAAPLLGDSGPWMIQADGRLQSETEDYGFGYHPHENVGHAAAHIAYRTDTFAVGAFYGIQNDHGSDVQQVGVEGQMYFSNVTLQASAAYGKHDSTCSGCRDDYDAWDVQGSATYYFNNSWSASVNVGYAQFNYTICCTASANTDITTVGLSAEYRIPNTNYSIRGAYTHGEASDTIQDYSSNTYQVSFVIDLGSDSARDRDQHGASLQGAEAFDQHWRLWEASYFID
ncbi:MAG: hypothetical protein JSS00_11640 [Proteobacteria bacterium]|nr:hypothetical protein [Pseudomonadota bacterium]